MAISTARLPNTSSAHIRPRDSGRFSAAAPTDLERINENTEYTKLSTRNADLRKDLSVIYFAPSNFGALDAFIPVISEINLRYGKTATIDCLYWGIKADERI
jgi:hypothetical protein